jgi:hypothetical protein
MYSVTKIYTIKEYNIEYIYVFFSAFFETFEFELLKLQK